MNSLFHMKIQVEGETKRYRSAKNKETKDLRYAHWEKSNLREKIGDKGLLNYHFQR